MSRCSIPAVASRLATPPPTTPVAPVTAIRRSSVGPQRFTAQFRMRSHGHAVRNHEARTQ